MPFYNPSLDEMSKELGGPRVGTSAMLEGKAMYSSLPA